MKKLVIVLIIVVVIIGVVYFRKEEKEIYSEDVFNELIEGRPIKVEPYSEEILMGSDPVLYDGLIPVKFEHGGWVKASTLEEWYSYENFNWANAICVKEEKREYYKNAEAGTDIIKDDVLGYFVWIPRFEYELFNVEFKPVQEQMIKVRFVGVDEEKKTEVKNGMYYTHPAFSTQSGELSGFWIAKFEPSLEDGFIKILSSKETLVNLNMADMWKYATGIKDSYNIRVDSRIITNMEYGAIAVLTYSQYGKKGNPEYKGLDSLVFLNTAMGTKDWDKIMTGCSAGTAINGGSYRCPYSYDYPYYGTGASSTGTIYGIYDLAGGSWECVMGIVSDYPIQNNLGKFNGVLPGNKRYYTFYKASNMYDYSRSIVGDMMGEVISISNPTRTWNGNNAYFATQSYPWIKRGGSFRGGSYSGIFDFGITDAAPRGDKTFRVILSEY